MSQQRSPTEVLTGEKHERVGTIKVMTNDQMPDLGKSINVFNNDPRVKNPFLRNGNSRPGPSGKTPAASNSSTPKK